MFFGYICNNPIVILYTLMEKHPCVMYKSLVAKAAKQK